MFSDLYQLHGHEIDHEYIAPTYDGGCHSRSAHIIYIKEYVNSRDIGGSTTSLLIRILSSIKKEKRVI